MRTFVSLAAVVFIATGVALAAGSSRLPGYDYGLTGNAWWAARQHAADIRGMTGHHERGLVP